MDHLEANVSSIRKESMVGIVHRLFLLERAGHEVSLRSAAYDPLRRQRWIHCYHPDHPVVAVFAAVTL